jgi:hypothetical protein
MPWNAAMLWMIQNIMVVEEEKIFQTQLARFPSCDGYKHIHNDNKHAT